MFANVIVGVDGSQSGREAVKLAFALAPEGGRITLAHVYGGAQLPGEGTQRRSTREGARERSQLLLQGERDATGVDAELISWCASSVGRGLHTLAEREGGDLLVVGSHRRGLAGRVLVGENTRASLNGAPCAVAVAPSGYVARSGGFLRIGVGYDFSPESRAALAVARALAARDAAKLRALHVMSVAAWGVLAPLPANWGDIVENDRRAAETKLSALEGVDATAVYGVASEELAAFGDRVDLLVVGSRSYGPLRRLLFGSTSSALARHARCALLVLPRTAASAGPGGRSGVDQLAVERVADQLGAR
ncbi:MAG: universal stress protein [Solirubrobacteraceae bacterium]|jgi:nucleotide-binding universal stress UspA family protein